MRVSVGPTSCRWISIVIRNGCGTMARGISEQRSWHLVSAHRGYSIAADVPHLFRGQSYSAHVGVSGHIACLAPQIFFDGVSAPRRWVSIRTSTDSCGALPKRTRLDHHPLATRVGYVIKKAASVGVAGEGPRPVLSQPADPNRRRRCYTGSASAQSLALSQRGDAVPRIRCALLEVWARQAWPSAQAVPTRGTGKDAEVHNPVVPIARCPVVLPVTVRHCCLALALSGHIEAA